MLPDQMLPDQMLPDQLLPDQMLPDLVPPDQGIPAVVITNSSPLPNGLINKPYSFSFTATGGLGPGSYKWSGSLPPWGKIDPNTGVFTGTPTSSGAFNLTIKVDSGPRSNQKLYQLAVASLLILSPGATPYMKATCSATSQIKVSSLFTGGLGPYTCKVYSGPGQGTFPTKLAYASSDPSGCTLTGGFDAAKDKPGAYGFIVTVTDGVGQTLDVPIACKNGDCPANMVMKPAIWPPRTMSPAFSYKWVMDMNDVNVLCKDAQCLSCGACSNTLMGISSPMTADAKLDCTKPGDICLFNSKLGIITSCPSVIGWHAEPLVKAHTPQRGAGKVAWNSLELTIKYSGSILNPCGNKEWTCHWDTLEK